METTSVSTSLYIPVELLERLDVIAKKRDRSRNWLAVKFLEQGIEQAESEQPPAPATNGGDTKKTA